MAKYANGITYREGNDNLNEHQFHQGRSGNSKMYSGLSGPETETRTTTVQGRGEKGGKWKRKGRKRIGQ